MMMNELYRMKEDEFADHMKKWCNAHPKNVHIKPIDGTNNVLLKYNRKVFYDRLWTPEVLECRGTIVDKDSFKIIQRPFTKIFHLGEQGTRLHRDRPVTTVRKVNGFMAAVSVVNPVTNELLVSTTGTTTSDFALFAKEKIEALDFKRLPFGYTSIFEIADSVFDPHVIPEEDGVYLLGMRENKWNTPNHCYKERSLDVLADMIKCKRPDWNVYERFSDVTDIVKTVDHEGFVVYTNDDGPYAELKLKSPFYTVVKYFGRMRNEKLFDILSGVKPLQKSFSEGMESLMALRAMGAIAKNREEFFVMNEQEKFAFLRSVIN